MKNILHSTSKLKILFAALLFLTGSSLFAQTAPMYVNTTTTGGCNSFPFNTTTSNKVQFLYTAGEFTGAPGGAINRIWIRPCTSVSGTVYTNFRVRMRQEPATFTQFSSGTYLTPVQTCLSASTYTFTTTANTWYPIPLTTPFIYDPTKTLIIEIEHQTYSGSGFTINQSGSGTGNRRIWGGYQATSGTAGTAYANMGIDVVSLGNNDIGVSSIDSPGIFCTPFQSIYATVKNYGKNQVTGFNIHWSINGVAQTTINSTATLDTMGGSGPNTMQFLLGTHTFSTSSITNIKAWTSMPNGVTDTIRLNDTSSVDRIPAFSPGTYTVGGSGANFATIDDAISAMATGGICGPVVLNINPGTYTRTTPINIPNIAGTSHINTITIQGANPSTTIFTGSLANTSMLLINSTKYITIRNITFTNNSTTNPGGIGIIGGTNKVSIINCRVNLPVNSGTSATGYGITVTGTASGVGVSACPADSVLLDSNVITGGGYAIVAYGSSNTLANRGLVFTNNTIINCNYMGGYIAYNYNPIIFNNNTINMRPGGEYSYYGLYYYYNYATHPTIKHQIRNNIINDFGGYGMYIYYPQQTTSTAKMEIHNNVVNSAKTGSYYGYYGIYLATPSGTYNVEVYHNTIAMNGPSTSTSYSAFYSTGSTSLLVKNNIFATYGGSYTPAYFATNPTGNVVNYNLYYNGANPTSGNLIYRNGTFFNPSNYKTATAGGDSSYNSNPSFINRLQNDLRLTDGCDGAGVGLSAFVPTDILGNTRSTTSPTLGAYEFAGGLANNLAVISILAPTPPITTGAQDLRFLVKNVGNNTITSYNATYVLNNGTPVTILQTPTLAVCATDTPTFTGTNQINLVSTNNITVYTSNPNFNTDPDRTNDTLRVSMFAPLSGTYTVGGTNPDFPNLQAAADALINGVAGPVVFDIRPGTYTGQVIIQGPIPGASSTNTITFEGNDATTRTVTANVSASVILIRQAKNVIIRNLTVTNTNTGNCGGIGVVGSSGNDDGSGCKIVKCRINLPILTTTSTNGWGIAFTGTTSGNGASAMGADSILIDSNIITGGAYAITVYGASNTSRNRGIVITNNIANNCNYMGGYIAYNYNPIICNNNEFNLQGNIYGYYGLYYYYNYASHPTISHEIIGNKVMNWGGYGMYIYYPMQTTSTAKFKLYNNLVVSGNGSSYPGYYGIYFGTPSGTYNAEAYHNTITMNGNATSTSYTCFYSFGTTAIQIKNNIFAVYAGTSTPLYLGTNPTGNVVNYNIYYNATSPTANLLYRGAFFNPSNYKTATAGGDSSFNLVPPFVSSTNFNLTNGCIRGVNLPAVPMDILGNPRSTNPNPGAYEYPGVSLDITPEAILQPTFPISTGTQDLRVLVRNNGSTTVTFFEIAYRLNNGTPVTTTFSGTLASCDTVSILFTGSNAINLINQTNTLRVYTYNVNLSTDLNPSNDTLDTQLNTPMSGTYVIGSAPSDYTTINNAYNALKLRGAAGTVIFNIKTGVYNEQVSLDNYPGSNIPGTMVWFQSQAGHRDSVRIQWNSGSGNAYVLNFNNVSRLGFRNLTIAQLSGSVFCYALSYSGINNFDSVDNCIISVPVYGTNGTGSTYTIYISSGAGTGLSWTNNRIVGSYLGNYIFGTSTTPLDYLNFSNNTIDSIAYSPLYYLYYTRFAKINNNTFLQRNLGFTCYSYFYYVDSGTQFINNKYDITANGYYHYMYYWRNLPSQKALIANNTFVANSANIYLYWGGYSQNLGFYNNTFSTNVTNGYAPYFYNISSSNIDVANNICYNYSTGHAAGYYQTTGITSDNNLYFTNGSNLIYRGTPAGSFTSLPLWRAAAPALDSNSIQYRPGITANMNPIPNPSDTASWSINARGRILADVATDINGNPRSQSVATGAPDLGAYEFTPTSTPPLCTPVPSTPSAGSTQAFLFGTDTVCTIEYDQFSTAPSTVGVRQYTGTIPPTIGSATAYPTFYISTIAPAGFYNFTMNLRYKDNWIGTIGSENDLKLAHKTPTAPWVVYQFTSTVNTSRNIISTPFLNEFGFFAGADNNNPLPVTLNSFSGFAHQADAVLNWTTGSERNSSHFVVERSLNNRNFEPIARVTAAGNSNVVNRYNYTDEQVFRNGTNVAFYRLKMVDKDGSYNFSNIITIKNINRNRLEASVYPNPFHNELKVMFGVKDDYVVEVFDITGKLLSTETFTNVEEATLSSMNNLKPGIYFVKINNEHTIKVIKQ